MNLRIRPLRTSCKPRIGVLFALLLILPAWTARAASPDHWVGTWATAPVAELNPDSKFLASDTTLREIVHVSLGGSQVRIVLSNEFGLAPLTIGGAHIALSAGHGAIDVTSANALTFGGHPSITIPPGALALSDPANMKLPAFADVAVSIYLPEQPLPQLSIHTFANQTSYSVPGNKVGLAKLEDPKEIFSWPILKGLDVKVSADSASIVAFGDSITDGAHSTRDANSRWPDYLAQRLQADKKTSHLGVLNEGIGGNRVLHDNTGPSALARFDRDVIAQAGVKYLIIMESINDIGHSQDPVRPYDVVTAEDLIVGLTQLAERAHTHGIKVIGATLTPYMGAKYSSRAGEAMRQAVNNWIRTTNQLDGVIDFDKATLDPAHPTVFLPAADSGDQLHPKDAGYKMMSDSIDIKLFTK